MKNYRIRRDKKTGKSKLASQIIVSPLKWWGGKSPIKGHVDSVSMERVRGWALSEKSEGPVKVHVLHDGVVIAEGTADAPRPDILKARGVLQCGFTVSSDQLRRLPAGELAGIKVRVIDASGAEANLDWKLEKMDVPGKNKPSSGGYQSHDGSKSSSDSTGKLGVIHLPDLNGKRFLDLGCNEGFFCGEALRQGATRVVGIEKNAKFVAAARALYPEAEFLEQTWDTLPNEQFDVIIMLSALHYEKQPRDLMKRIYDRLAPDGLFILENGCVMAGNQKCWIEVPRAVGVVKYPTLPLLRDHILEDFAPRLVGRSVNQAGDPLPRYVFHCRKKKTNYIIVGGNPNTGKTSLGVALDQTGVVHVRIDQLLIDQSKREIKLADKKLSDYIRQIEHNKINRWVEAIKDEDMALRLAKFLANSLPEECSVVYVEGYVFSNSLVMSQFKSVMEQRRSRIWHAEMLS